MDKTEFKNIFKGNENIMYEYLKREVQILETLSQFENSVKFYGFYETENDFIFELEFCDMTLSSYIEKHGKLEIQEIKKILIQLNNVFKALEGFKLIHRDLKPENILLKFIDNKNYIVKLSDYGTSRQLKDNKKVNTVLGTPVFMAPEIITQMGEYDEKADLYELGATIYFILFNQYPYGIDSLIPFFVKNMENDNAKPKLRCSDPLLNDLLEKTLKINPKKRIGWKEYFAHPFFGEENQKKINNMENYKPKLNIQQSLQNNQNNYQNVQMQQNPYPQNNQFNNDLEGGYSSSNYQPSNNIYNPNQVNNYMYNPNNIKGGDYNSIYYCPSNIYYK